MYIFEKDIYNTNSGNELQKNNPRAGGARVRWKEYTNRSTTGSEVCAKTPLTAAGTFSSSPDASKVYENKKNVMPILPVGKIQGIFKLNKIIGRSLEFFAHAKNRDDIIYFEAAEILGSKLSFCLRMTFSVLTLTTLLSFSIISDLWATCGSYQYEKDGTCYNCPGMPGYCYWDEGQGKAVMTGCDASYILCGESCKHPLTGIYKKDGICYDCPSSLGTCRWDEDQGKAVMTYCSSPYILCGGSCKYDGSPYIKGLKCDESTGNLVATGCGDWSPAPGVVLYYKLKDGQCISGSCGSGYVEGDGVCHKIPTGCDSVSAADGNCTKCSAGYSLDDNDNCVQCNKEGFKDVHGYCNRIRYTPAEAAKVLHDDNTNSVTITFKK